MPEISCDALVIGAGPAGSAAALLLARRGYDVRLLDRARFPRDKPCGEYLTPGAIEILRDDLDALPALLRQNATWLSEERIVGRGGRGFSGKVRSLSCPRIITDAVLIEAARAAGAQVHEGTAVRRITFDGARVAGAVAEIDGEETHFRARVTIGADGTHSLLARALRAVRPIQRLQRIALVGHYAPVGGDKGIENAANFVTMHLPANDARNACCGMGAPCGPEGTVNVNIVVPTAEARNMANRQEAYFDETLAHVFPTAWGKVRNMRRVGGLRSVGCFAHNTRRAAYPGALLVGDAATFIHPFTGEGVFFALRGAQLAADAIDAVLRGGKADDLRAYDRGRRRELLPRYLLCDAVAQIVHSPSLLCWAAERMRRAPALADALLEAAGDRIQPLDLLTPQNLRLFLTTL